MVKGESIEKHRQSLLFDLFEVERCRHFFVDLIEQHCEQHKGRVTELPEESFQCLGNFLNECLRKANSIVEFKTPEKIVSLAGNFLNEKGSNLYVRVVATSDVLRPLQRDEKGDSCSF